MNFDPHLISNIDIYKNRIEIIDDVFYNIYNKRYFYLKEYAEKYITKKIHPYEEVYRILAIVMDRVDNEIKNKRNEIKENLLKELNSLYEEIHSMYATHTKDILIELKLQSITNYAGRLDFEIFLWDRLKEIIKEELGKK